MIPCCSNVPQRPWQGRGETLQAVVGQIQGAQMGIVAELAVQTLQAAKGMSYLIIIFITIIIVIKCQYC